MISKVTTWLLQKRKKSQTKSVCWTRSVRASRGVYSQPQTKNTRLIIIKYETVRSMRGIIRNKGNIDGVGWKKLALFICIGCRKFLLRFLSFFLFRKKGPFYSFTFTLLHCFFLFSERLLIAIHYDSSILISILTSVYFTPSILTVFSLENRNMMVAENFRVRFRKERLNDQESEREEKWQKTDLKEDTRNTSGG